jgi:hypothetical protein
MEGVKEVGRQREGEKEAEAQAPRWREEHFRGWVGGLLGFLACWRRI